MHTPNDKTRASVAALAAKGVSHAVIAKMGGLSENTLRKHYQSELDIGGATATADITGKLYDLAMGGDNTSCIFWLKCRDAWNDKPVDWTDDERKLVQLMRALGYRPNDIRDGLLHASAKELGTPIESVKKLVAKCPK